MKNSIELIDEKEQLRQKAEQILEVGIKEQRKLSDKEQTKYNSICKNIADLDEEIRNLKNNINTNKTEMKKFSLLKAINDIANNRNLDETAQEVVKRGMAEMKKSGQSYSGQIVLPVEMRDTDGVITGSHNFTADTNNGGKENVTTDVLNILEPLRANLVSVAAGANFMTGLVGNVQIPVYSGSNVGWADETAAAANGTGNFSDVELSPKRLTAYVDVSKQFLVQDSNSAEEMLQRDIVNAISEKLEQTIFGTGAGSTSQPKGLLNGVTAETAAITWADIVKMEAALEDKNVNGDMAFIVSPSAKADLKTTAIGGTKSDIRMICDGNEIDGIPVYTSSAVAGKGVVLGNFSDYVIGQWGATDITVDPYTQAANGKVRLVVNAYFDAKPRRAEAFQKKVLKA